MILFILYILGGISFCLWDACIGWGIDFDGFHTPPLGVVAGLWFISVPILLVYNFVILCYYLKNNRIERQKKKEEFRIQEEKRVAIESKNAPKKLKKHFYN